METIRSFTLPQDRNIFSYVMEMHQRNSGANGKILQYLSQNYLYPTNLSLLVYASQLLQADAIRYGVEHLRRNRTDNRCMGAIYWQLNDIWPVASWASIDYFGRWKALHYAAKRFFAPVMISCEEDGELTQQPNVIDFMREPVVCSVRLNVTNETMKDVSGIVRWALRNPDGSIVLDGSENVTVPALSAKWLDRMVFEEARTTGSYMSYSYEVGGEVISEGTVLFCAPKHFEFVNPNLSVRLEGDEIVVRADAFARFVCIESDDPDMVLSDNFFDLNACEKRVSIVRGKAENLRVRSVFEMAE
jgi:beta-mannosidase